MVVSTRLPPPPPPLCSNVSRSWCFSVVLIACHHHHLPRIQTRDGGGIFRSFRATATTTTSLVFKCWCFSVVSIACHHRHLPRVQTRAGGVIFSRFDAPATTTTSLVFKHKPEVVFSAVSTTTNATKNGIDIPNTHHESSRGQHE